MSLAPGTRLGSYDIIALLGAGGMGEVYRARDTRLKRDVAIKVLPDAFANDPERLARFQREAELLATLNHPNIAQIHGLEDRALILELVEGLTLADRIAQGSMPFDEALPMARQIAEALEAAHERGVIHRDLKPANIKLTADGKVKVLDFGLAKAIGPAEAGHYMNGAGSVRLQADLSMSPTITSPVMTMGGVILGTAAYMSPEQARGKSVDRRADIWAYGVVLYEMLTGRTLFPGETTTDVLAAIVKENPDWSALPQATPASIRRLLRRCLEKDPARRMRHIGDAILEIDEKSGLDDVASSHLSSASLKRRRAWMLAAGATALAAGSWGIGLFLASRSQPADVAAPTRRFQLPIEKLEYMLGSDAAISPDGRRVAYKADGRLWIRPLDRLEPVEVRGSVSGYSPFWSPDGQTLAFGVDRKLVASRDASGEPTAICDIPDTGFLLSGAWAANGTIAFSAWRGSVYSVSARGGEASRLVTVDPKTEVDFRHLTFLHGTQQLLATARLIDGDHRIEELTSGRRMTILEHAQLPLYSASKRHLLYLRASSLWAVPFDPAKLQVTGTAFPVQNNVTQATAADDGTLVLMPIPRALHQLVWIDRSGRVGQTIGEPQLNLTMPALSPDGRKVAVTAQQAGNSDIWLHDVERGTRVRLTLTDANETWPAWSPGGDRILFMTQSAPTASTISVVREDGGVAWQLVANGHQPAVTGDGKHVVYLVESIASRDLWYSPLQEAGQSSETARALLVTTPRELRPRSSPDGRWIAYVSDESGHNEVYVIRFPEATARVLVSRGGGTDPRWRKDGRELYFLQGGAMMAVDIDLLTDRATVSAARQLFNVSEAGALPDYPYDVSADGKRFVMVRDVTDGATEPTLIVIENWFAEFAPAQRR